MIEFDDALARLLAEVADVVRTHGVERISVGEASGRVLAEDVCAEAAVPLTDYSAMDGYALNTSALGGDGPWELPVVAESRAGHSSAQLGPAESARIFTGAALPSGADVVVMQENVERRGAAIRFADRPAPGANVRRAGEDLAVGEVALRSGTRLSGFQLGLLATVERVEVTVACRPRVAILCTGDELRAPGRPGAAGLAESNGVALAALVRSVGGEPSRLPVVPDSREATRLALRAASAAFEVVLTVGGVSVGEHDHIKPALEELGARSVFSKVNIKPGKPVLFACHGATLVLGLPGNPSSAQVTFALFGAPLLRALQGDAEPVAERRVVPLSAPLRQKPGRPSYYRGRLRGGQVEVFTNQASGASTAIAWANCLVVIGAEVEELRAGTPVEVVAYADL